MIRAVSVHTVIMYLFLKSSKKVSPLQAYVASIGPGG